MANRRCLQALTRCSSSLFTNPSLQSLPLFPNPPLNNALTSTSTFLHLFADSIPDPLPLPHNAPTNYAVSPPVNKTIMTKNTKMEKKTERVARMRIRMRMCWCEVGKRSEYTAEEKEAEAAAIGYKVVGPLHKDDRVFKPYEPVFAVIQIGSHQFKVSNGDCVFTERLKLCEAMISQTSVGRPIVPDAAVHAVVEEHVLDAKVIIFKKKRRKNYRRTKGHQQELIKLRITDIQGLEKPQNTLSEKPSKAAKKIQEKVAVAA